MEGGVWKDWLSRAVMNVTPRHAPLRLKFVMFGTHTTGRGGED